MIAVSYTHLDVYKRQGGVHFIIEVYQKLLNSFSVPLIEAAEVGERKNSAQSGQLFFFQAFPDAVTGKEENGLGMVDDMMHIVGRKVCLLYTSSQKNPLQIRWKRSGRWWI